MAKPEHYLLVTVLMVIERDASVVQYDRQIHELYFEDGEDLSEVLRDCANQ